MIMFAESRFGSPSFILVAKGLVELHRLIKDGRDETPEAEGVSAERIRDAFTSRELGLWEMTVGEIGRAHV